LKKAIAFHIFGMLAPIVAPVVWILLHPALVSVSLILSIEEIILQPLTLPPSFSGTLTILFLTVSMVLYAGIGKKKTSAIGICTSDLLAHGFPPGETINPNADPDQGRREIRSKIKYILQISEEENGKDIKVGDSLTG